MWTARPVVMVIAVVSCHLSATLACAQPRAPLDPRVKAEIATVDAQIAEAEADNAKYSGGLVKALVESRLATLKQTRAMLAQRATAGDLNVAIRYTVDGKPFTLPDGTATALAAVEGELEGVKAKTVAAEAEAARYSGGLVQAMALTTWRQRGSRRLCWSRSDCHCSSGLLTQTSWRRYAVGLAGRCRAPRR